MSSRRAPRAALVVLGWLLVSAPSTSDATTSTIATIPAFDASASAAGLSAAVVFQRAPLTDTPVDTSGPTAQVGGSTIDDAVAYAAFPNPGPFVASVPGTFTGLFNQKFGVDLPAAPAYPFAVTADSLHPDQDLGSGPYKLTAHSNGHSGDATAIGGAQDSASGNVSLLLATASLDATPDGVTVTATSSAEALSIGPLMIGRIRSTATMKLEPGSATATPTATTDITGVQVATVPVAISPEGLEVAGSPVPLPIGDTLSAVLAEAGITAEVLPGFESGDRIVAPAVRITMPVDGSALGANQGTMTIVLGGATASLTGVAPQAHPVHPDVSVAGAIGPGPESSGAPLSSRSPATAPPATSSASSTGSSIGANRPVAANGRLLRGLFDIRSLYLVVSGCAVACWALGQLVRTRGMRERWTSTAG
ncbi:MAG: hypothetical protein QOC92_2287 [Acidimicrobiaceae bacterium]